MKTLAIILVTTVIAVPMARAQLVADGATNTLANVTNTITGNATIGTNGSFTLLVLSDNVLLTNSANGNIGLNGTAKSNAVRLISPTARWRMGGTLYVGSNGSLSRLVVSNGAFVESGSGSFAFRVGSSNNLAVVSDSGSLWSNRFGLDLGGLGPGNTLIVTNGGGVYSRTARLGVDASSSNNLALISGAGSVWSNALSLSVGNIAPGNRLVVEAGGSVISDTGVVGDFNSASNNEALVTGVGSLWTNSSGLTIGSQMPFNRLVVSNGAAVRSGSGTLRTLNNLVVTGNGSIWSNGTLLVLSGRADVTNGGWLACGDGYVNGASNAVVLSGASGWNNLGALRVGDFANGTMLIASNGATVLSSNALIGSSTSLGNNNLVLITGSNSLWTNREDLLIGNFGAGNRLEVNDGATVQLGGHGWLGGNYSGAANSVTVSGPGTGWQVKQAVYVGSNSPFNRLLITNGASVRCLSSEIGYNYLAATNEVIVTGPGSLFDIGGFLIIGQGSSGNRVVITNGGTVRSYAGVFGDTTSARGNQVIVTGAASLWTNADSLVMGNLGDGDRLEMVNGGEVDALNQITIGTLQFSSTNNRAIVDGGILRTGTLNVRGGTNVLNAGLVDVNQLLLTNLAGWFEFNGGTLITRGAVISNDLPFVVGTTGPTPAVWDVRNGVTNTLVASDLIIGSSASFNQLILTNGALLTNTTFAMLGRNFGANSNSVFLANPGSRWWLNDGVTIGNFGSGNRLVVSNGASLVAGSSSVLGNQSTSSNNEAVVTGPGTTWDNAAFVVVGGGGTDNRLLIKDGAVVQSWYGNIGHSFASTSNNLALVTGSGSTWSNAFELRVGDVGPANQLVVSNGGTVFAGSATYEGYATSALNSRVTVDGGTLRATNAAATGLLDVRRGFFTLNSGLVEADRILATNAAVTFNFNGGTMSARSSSFAIAPDVGNSTTPATFFLAGNGTHDLPGLVVRPHGSLSGNGTINGIIVTDAVMPLGVISPGASIGKIVLNNSPILNGIAFMEISKNDSMLTNDQIQVNAPLRYRGTLTVTNLGPTPLAVGDKFQLFPATSYSGAFVTMNLPPLPAGLGWTNKLLLDGSIEVVSASQPRFSNIIISGTNAILSGANGTAGQSYAVLTATNITTPLSNWLSLGTNQFGAGGAFSFTNGITPGELQRYFQIRTP